MAAAKRAWPWLALALALLCWCGATALAGETARLSLTVTLDLGEDALAGGVFRDMRESEALSAQPLPFTLWRQADGRTVENPAFLRQTDLSVLILRGDSSLVLPGAPLLPAGDKTGCLLDRASSYALFGDEEALGGVITWEGEEYVVRGVFTQPQGTLVLQGREDQGPYPLVSLGAPAEGSPREAASAFALRHGLRPVSITPGADAAGWSGFWAAAPALFLFCILAWQGLRTSLFLRHTPIRMALYLLGPAAGLLLFAKIAGLSFAFPDGLVPTRWSDFGFWGSLWDEKKEQFFLWFWGRKHRPDQALLTLALCSSLLGGAGAILLGAGVRHIRPRCGSQLAGLTAYLLAAAFAAQLWVGRAWPLYGQTALFLALPCFFLLRSLLRVPGLEANLEPEQVP